MDHLKWSLYLRNMFGKYCGYNLSAEKEIKSMPDANICHQSGMTLQSANNIVFQIPLDIEKWGNMALGDNKHFEKDNKIIKYAIRNGAISKVAVNRAMEFTAREFKVQYLLEGNAISSDKKLKPYTGDYKINMDLLKDLKCENLSPFVDRLRNPHKPKYMNTHQFIDSNAANVESTLFERFKCDFCGNRHLLYDELESLFVDKDANDNKYTKSKSYVHCKIYRDFKEIDIRNRCLVTDKAGKELLIIINLFKLRNVEGYVCGHKVKLNERFDQGDTVRSAIIMKELECWPIEKVYCKGMYYHENCSECEVKKESTKHKWANHPRIVVFWYLGMGQNFIYNPFDQNISPYGGFNFYHSAKTYYGIQKDEKWDNDCNYFHDVSINAEGKNGKKIIYYSCEEPIYFAVLKFFLEQQKYAYSTLDELNKIVNEQQFVMTIDILDIVIDRMIEKGICCRTRRGRIYLNHSFR